MSKIWDTSFTRPHVSEERKRGIGRIYRCSYPAPFASLSRNDRRLNRRSFFFGGRDKICNLGCRTGYRGGIEKRPVGGHSLSPEEYNGTSNDPVGPLLRFAECCQTTKFWNKRERYPWSVFWVYWEIRYFYKQSRLRGVWWITSELGTFPSGPFLREYTDTSSEQCN